MQLNGDEWRPMSLARSWLAKAAGPVLLVGVILCCCAWVLPAHSNQEDSLAGRMLAALSQPIANRDKAGLRPKQQQDADGPSKATEPPVLYTRAFKVDPVTFIKGLQEASAMQMPAVKGEGVELPASQSVPFIKAIQNVDSTNTAHVAIRQLFRTAGIELTPPKALFWNDRLGMLMVRAPLEELDAIEKVIQVMNMAPPQLTIETKIVEMPEAAVKQLGLDWLGTTVTATISANQARNPFVDTNATTANYAMVLTDPQYRVIFRALEQRTGVDVLSLPKVTTLSARQAQIKTVSIKSVVTGTTEKTDQSGVFDLVITQHECGPIIDVVPMVHADGYTIDLTVITTSREFLGYESTSETVKVLNDDGKIGSAPKPLPEFRVRQAVAAPTIWDGQTFAMGMGRFEGRDRVAFVTVTIIDPAGNRVHGEDEGEFRMRGIPPQRKVSEPNVPR
jgi:type II secretory pathway component GspD/PulD (secretin)